MLTTPMEVLAMSRLSRPARGAVIALALACLVAAPVAAAQPIRTVIYFDPGTRALPAGSFCAFDVTSVRLSTARLTITDFSDGSEASMGLTVRRSYTNNVTGKTFTADTTAHEVDWYGATTVQGVATGQFIYQFLPGDVGPGGVIVDHLTELYIQGTVTYVYDANTYATLAFSLVGTTTDICAAIS
jgi:hypothetical protein